MATQESGIFQNIGQRLRFSLWVKLLAIGFIALLLLIPKAMIEQLVMERQARQESVILEISESWGGRQSVRGPIIKIPARDWTSDVNGRKVAVIQNLYFLPSTLQIEGKADHEIRSRGIFDAVLFRSNLTLKGTFDPVAFQELNVAPEDILWEEARIVLGISSMAGIQNPIEVEWNGAKFRMEPGTETGELLSSGVSAPLVLSPGGEGYRFSIPLELNGAESLFFEPVGQVTTVSLNSDWPSPAFIGRMLPDKRALSDKGFSADWKILDLNRNYPQQWKNLAYRFEEPLIDSDGQVISNSSDYGGSSFGVRFLRPVDEYLKNTRAAKHGILVIGLTFLIYFFFETLRGLRIHPFQYLLTGLALVVFYLLLLSLSEHIGFNPAYWVAAVATIGLIAVYSASLLKSRSLTYQLILLLILIFGFIFVVLQLEDYALLVGSIGLFIALAAVMYFSRKVDWNTAQDGNGA
jgi:inner membrane protein